MPKKQTIVSSWACFQILTGLPEPEVCPADFLPRTGTMTVEMKADCSVDPVQCVELCKEGGAAGCYFVASKYQFRKGFSGYARSLFLQSCKGGINSGCTNAAVKFDRPTMSAEEIHDCENLTYEPMCQDGDYWGLYDARRECSQRVGDAAQPKPSNRALQCGVYSRPQ